jgi:pimeloyl-ACP methyl ester carboxylesterase
VYLHEPNTKPCLVYSHSHSGNRAEGANLFEPAIEHFSLVLFDYAGYGHSGKELCTLGLKEQADLELVVTHVRAKFGFKSLFIWGRSMGAVTALLLGQKLQAGLCQGLVLDSPFSSTKEMVAARDQLYNVMDSVPNFVLYLLFIPLGSKLKEVTGFDVMDIDLNELVKKAALPAFFIVGSHDKVSGTKNVRSLFESYGSCPPEGTDPLTESPRGPPKSSASSRESTRTGDPRPWSRRRSSS